MESLRNGLIDLIDDVRNARSVADYLAPFEAGYGSPSLKHELLDAVGDSKHVFNFAFTDYGGTFMDNAFIQFAKKYYPECIVWENTSWSGENAFVFGELADVLAESSDWYYADFKESFEDSWGELEYQFCDDAWRLVAEEFPEENREDVVDWLHGNKDGYYGLLATELDFYFEEVENEVREALNLPKGEE